MSRPAIGFRPVFICLKDRTDKSVTQAKWDGQPMRAPKKGELFLSGAQPMAYRALVDMTQEYFIAVEIK